MRKMFETGKTYTNDWWPDETKDADPKNPYYKDVKEEYGAGEEGTTKLKNKYMEDTPFSKIKKFKNYIK